MNDYLRWYQRVVWFGIVANLSFSVAALWAPDRLQRLFRLKPLTATVWLRNVGMLLVLVSMFNAGAAVAPRRYPLYSWFVPFARLIAGSFFFRVAFFNPHHSSDRPKSFLPLFAFDTAMGVICSILLHLGLPNDGRLIPSLRRAVSRGR